MRGFLFEIDMKVTVIVTAAGFGSRYSRSGKPKQFLSFNGKPVILYSLFAFQYSKFINEIIVSASKEYFDFIHSLSLKNKITKLTNLVEGGETRFQSVRNAFRQVESSGDDIVIIHDAVRPYIYTDTYFIERLLMEIKKFDGVVPGIKIPETVKRAKNYIVTETIDRENLFTIQTPQVFRYKALKVSYEKYGSENDFTDEAALVERAGYRVKVAEGMRENIKITTPEDMRNLKLLWLNADSVKYGASFKRKK
jgi:2-C-methyl-D-erythritol 4-phosphate cytidylyltransferase